MKPPESFRTDRLVLRIPRLDDAEEMFAAYCQDPEVIRYMPWPAHIDSNETRSVIERMRAQWESGEYYNWGIIFEDRFVGTVGLRIRDFKADIGYCLARSEWNKGIMSEAAKAVLDWCMEQPEIYRVEAFCDSENVGSARVMEKIGMKREGVLKRWGIHPGISNEPRDCVFYAKTK